LDDYQACIVLCKHDNDDDDDDDPVIGWKYVAA
jgi:hypothetical protein